MSAVLERTLSLDIQTDSKAQKTPEPWTADMEPFEEEATDKILEYLIQSGARPQINATGDIINIVTCITNSLNQAVPPHLSDHLKIMTDYIARWLCDYIEQTNITSLNVAFGFDAKIMQDGDL